MSFSPKFKLYDSTGSTLLYTFLAVQATNAPQSVAKSVVIEGVRGKGCLVVDGGEACWDLFITGLFFSTETDGGEAYQDLTVKIDALESAVDLNTAYVLKIDKTPTTTYSFNVKRLDPIEYPENLRTSTQEYRIIFKANSW